MAAALTARQRLVAAVWVAALAAVTFVLLPKWQASRDGAAARPSGRVVLRGVITGTPQGDMAPTRVVVWAASRGRKAVRGWEGPPPVYRTRMEWDAPSSGPFELDISPVCADLAGYIMVYADFDHPACKPVRRHARAWLPSNHEPSARAVYIDAPLETAVRLRGRVVARGASPAHVSVFDVTRAVPSKDPGEVAERLQAWQRQIEAADEVDADAEGRYELAAPRGALLVVVAHAPGQLPSWLPVPPQASATYDVPPLTLVPGVQTQGHVEQPAPFTVKSLRISPELGRDAGAWLSLAGVGDYRWTRQGPQLDEIHAPVQADGSFVAEGLLAGRVRYQADHLWPRPDRFGLDASTSLRAEPEWGDAPASDVRVSFPSSRVRVELVDESGAPVSASYHFNVEMSGFCGGTSAAGAQWYVPPGVAFRVQPTTMGPWTFPEYRGRAAEEGGVRDVRIVVQSAPGPATLRLQVEPRLASFDAYLTAEWKRGGMLPPVQREHQLTFVDGTTPVLSLPPGHYVFFLRPAGGAPRPDEEEGWWTAQPVTVDLLADEERDLVIPLEEGGRFELTAGPAAPGLLAEAWVRVLRDGCPTLDNPRMTARRGFGYGEGPSATLTAHGPHRSVEGLPAGAYHVEVRTREGHKLLQRFEITPRTTTRIEIEPSVGASSDGAAAENR